VFYYLDSLIIFKVSLVYTCLESQEFSYLEYLVYSYLESLVCLTWNLWCTS